MGNTTTASVTGVQVAPAKSAIRDLPIAKVWAFAVGQFGWALLSGIISNWLVYFYQPDQETISQGQTVFVPQGLVVLGIVTVVGGITAFADSSTRSWTRPWRLSPTVATPNPAAVCRS